MFWYRGRDRIKLKQTINPLYLKDGCAGIGECPEEVYEDDPEDGGVNV